MRNVLIFEFSSSTGEWYRAGEFPAVAETDTHYKVLSRPGVFGAFCGYQWITKNGAEFRCEKIIEFARRGIR